MVALVLSRLDYGSTVLFGLPQQLVDKLQSVQNATAQCRIKGGAAAPGPAVLGPTIGWSGKLVIGL